MTAAELNAAGTRKHRAGKGGDKHAGRRTDEPVLGVVLFQVRIGVAHERRVGALLLCKLLACKPAQERRLQWRKHLEPLDRAVHDAGLDRRANGYSFVGVYGAARLEA